jgi:hypothetical protein
MSSASIMYAGGQETADVVTGQILVTASLIGSRQSITTRFRYPWPITRNERPPTAKNAKYPKRPGGSMSLLSSGSSESGFWM